MIDRRENRAMEALHQTIDFEHTLLLITFIVVPYAHLWVGKIEENTNALQTIIKLYTIALYNSTPRHE